MHDRLYYTPLPSRYVDGRLRPVLNMYGQPSYLTWSLVDRELGSTIEHPDQAAFPRFTNATWTDVVIHAGQCLYIPAGWGHKVHTPVPTLMLNYWAKGTPMALRGAPMQGADFSDQEAV